MDPLTELLNLLACRDADPDTLAQMAQAVRNASDDPELDWAHELGASMKAAVLHQLGGWLAVSDKIDELHEQLEDQFEDPLPPFPCDRYDQDVVGYFDWLSEELARRAPDEGGYDLVLFEFGFNDEMEALTVYRRDVPRILELANQVALDGRVPSGGWVRRATEVYRG
jgi:hypothetical protein